MKYEKTEDKNIFKQIQEIESEIRLDILEKQIVSLETQISNFPQKVEYPKDVSDEVKGAIDYYNQMRFPDKKEILEKKLQKKRNFLIMLKGL